MMENRSFGHIMGWLPALTGSKPSRTSTTGASHSTFALAPEFQGCAFQNPDHSYDGSRRLEQQCVRRQLRAGKNDVFSIGYTTGATSRSRTRRTRVHRLRRYFAPILAPTFPNRYLHAGVTDASTTRSPVTSTTIWDRLAAASCCECYCGNVNFLLLWNQKYNPIHTYSRFFADCKTGKLPRTHRRPQLHARRR